MQYLNPGLRFGHAQSGRLKGLFDMSGHGVLPGRPFGTEIILPSATVYSLQICRNSLAAYS